MKEHRSLLRVKVLRLPTQVCVYYPGCTQCFSKLYESNSKWRCMKCGNSYSHPRFRYRLRVAVTDGETVVDVTVFGSHAETVMGCSAEDLHRKLQKLHYEGFGVDSLMQVALDQTLVGNSFMMGFKYTGPSTLDPHSMKLSGILDQQPLSLMSQTTLSSPSLTAWQMFTPDGAAPITTVLSLLDRLADAERQSRQNPESSSQQNHTLSPENVSSNVPSFLQSFIQNKSTMYMPEKSYSMRQTSLALSCDEISTSSINDEVQGNSHLCPADDVNNTSVEQARNCAIPDRMDALSMICIRNESVYLAPEISSPDQFVYNSRKHSNESFKSSHQSYGNDSLLISDQKSASVKGAKGENNALIISTTNSLDAFSAMNCGTYKNDRIDCLLLDSFSVSCEDKKPVQELGIPVIATKPKYFHSKKDFASIGINCDFLESSGEASGIRSQTPSACSSSSTLKSSLNTQSQTQSGKINNGSNVECTDSDVSVCKETPLDENVAKKCLSTIIEENSNDFSSSKSNIVMENQTLSDLDTTVELSFNKNNVRLNESPTKVEYLNENIENGCDENIANTTSICDDSEDSYLLLDSGAVNYKPLSPPLVKEKQYESIHLLRSNSISSQVFSDVQVTQCPAVVDNSEDQWSDIPDCEGLDILIENASKQMNQAPQKYATKNCSIFEKSLAVDVDEFCAVAKCDEIKVIGLHTETTRSESSCVTAHDLSLDCLQEEWTQMPESEALEALFKDHNVKEISKGTLGPYVDVLRTEENNSEETIGDSLPGNSEPLNNEVFHNNMSVDSDSQYDMKHLNDGSKVCDGLIKVVCQNDDKNDSDFQDLHVGKPTSEFLKDNDEESTAEGFNSVLSDQSMDLFDDSSPESEFTSPEILKNVSSEVVHNSICMDNNRAIAKSFSREKCSNRKRIKNHKRKSPCQNISIELLRNHSTDDLLNENNISLDNTPSPALIKLGQKNKVKKRDRLKSVNFANHLCNEESIAAIDFKMCTTPSPKPSKAKRKSCLKSTTSTPESKKRLSRNHLHVSTKDRRNCRNSDQSFNGEMLQANSEDLFTPSPIFVPSSLHSRVSKSRCSVKKMVQSTPATVHTRNHVQSDVFDGSFSESDDMIPYSQGESLFVKCKLPLREKVGAALESRFISSQKSHVSDSVVGENSQSMCLFSDSDASVFSNLSAKKYLSNKRKKFSISQINQRTPLKPMNISVPSGSISKGAKIKADQHSTETDNSYDLFEASCDLFSDASCFGDSIDERTQPCNKLGALLID